MRRTVTVALLAGGKSSRFGGIDKQEILLNGEKLGRIAAMNALSAGGDVIVVGKNRRPYDALPLSFVEDIVAGFGPLSGLHSALSAARTDWVYLIACDMPFFDVSWLDYLLSCAERSEALSLAARLGRHIEPFQALYSRRLVRPLDKIFEERGEPQRSFSFARLIESVPHHLVPENIARTYSPDWRLFCSINAPEDLATLRSLPKGAAKGVLRGGAPSA